MIDSSVTFRQFLLTSPDIMTKVGDASHVVVGELPEGADPGKGEFWITVRSRGGPPPHREVPIFWDSFEVVVWAAKNSIVPARQIAGYIYDLAHEAVGVYVGSPVVGFIINCFAHTPPQDLIDTATEWSMAITYYDAQFRAQLA